MPKKLINLIRMTTVRANNALLKNFKVEKGLRQGDPLPTVLFNIIVEKMIMDSGIKREDILHLRKVISI